MSASKLGILKAILANSFMKTKRNHPKGKPRTKPAPIRTTLMELLQELLRLTTDDDVVLAVVRNIFHSYRVRMAYSHAPVRLVSAEVPMGPNIQNRLSVLRDRCA